MLGEDYCNPFLMDINYTPHRNLNDSQKLQLRVMRHYYFQLYNIAISRFTWTGLPEEIHPFKLEEILIREGGALFAYDKDARLYTVSKVITEGKQDIYGFQNERVAFYMNHLAPRKYNKNDSILMHDKPIPYPLLADIQLYASSLSEMWMTRKMNLYGLRTPFFVTSDQDSVLDFENIAKDYNEFIPWVKVRQGANPMGNIDVLKTGVTPIFTDLGMAMRQEKSAIITAMGIPANPIEKREREITAEANGNDGERQASKNVFLNVRERSRDQINDTFGLKVDVKFNIELEDTVKSFVDGGDPV